MVNKEFIVGSGGIIKDFQDRNIPQNSNNFVSVGVLIPTSEFEGLGTYGVCLATSKIVGGVETSLPSLICYRAKTIKIEGVDYIKYQCQLSISYTDFIGQLKLTPYIIEIETLNEGEEDEEVVITTQKTFTNTTLNVIRSIASTSDASLEEAEAVDTLTALIEAKNIKLVDDYKNGTKAQAIVGCFTDYNASAYEGWLLIVKYSGGEIALLPYKNGANNEFTEIDLDGIFYKLSNYSSGSYDSTKLTYTKNDIDTILTSYYTKSETYSQAETDALLDGKVDKTFTISGKALSGSGIQLEKGDVGLGNVANYNTINSPTQNANTSWVNAGGLWTYLKTNYADKSDYDTTKAKVEELYASFKGTGDNDNVVNTLYDLIQVFQNFPEADNIATILSGLDSRIDALEGLNDALITINQSITILTTDWVSNSGDYSSDYPYKTTIQNDLLIDAEAFEIVFSVDSDTSLLSTTAILDNETGTITLYASETPSDDIVINKINAVNGLNAISTITTDTINQVQQNKNDISDINNVKLPNCIQKSDTSGLVKNDGTIDTNEYLEKTIESIYLEGMDRYNYKVDVLNSSHKFRVKIYKKSTIDANYTEKASITLDYNIFSVKTNENAHELTFDANGDLKIDGNAVGGGGSQLYEHNISFYGSTLGNWMRISFVSSDNTEINTKHKLWQWLVDNGFADTSSNIEASGNINNCKCKFKEGNGSYGGGTFVGIIASSETEDKFYYLNHGNSATVVNSSNFTDVYDLVRTL